MPDPGDPRLDGYRDLINDGHGSRADRNPETFVVEGVTAIGAVLAGGWAVRSVLLSEGRARRRPDLVEAAEAAGADVYVAAEDLLYGVAGYRVHRGALALAVRPPPRRLADVLGAVTAGAVTAGAGIGPGAAPVVLVTERVNDLENLGALFRNGAAFGAAAVLMDPETADPLYRRSVRVSAGHVIRVPFARVEPWPGALEEVKGAGLAVVALTPGGDETLDEMAAVAAGGASIRAGTATPAGSAGWAVMVGAEGPGLSPAALAAADHRVRIPMAPGVDSLNVATAAAVALHRLAARPG